MRSIAPVCALLLPAMFGCAHLLEGSHGPSGSAELTSATYDGDECDEVRMTEKEVVANHGSGMTKANTSMRAQALVPVCPVLKFTRTEYGRDVVSHRWRTSAALNLRAAHLAFQDRHFDDLTAALFVIGAAFPEEGIHGYSPEKKPHSGEQAHADDEASEEEMKQGLAVMYGRAVDRAHLDAQLNALKLTGGVHAAIVGRFEAAKKEIAAHTAAMPEGKRKIFVDMPLAVLKSRRAYYAQHQAEYAALDALAVKAEAARSSGDAAAPVAAGLTKLRSDYMRGCGIEECSYDPFYVEATRELALLYVGTRNPLLARAESTLLTRSTSNKEGFARKIYDEQSKLALAAREAYETAKSASAKGMDAKVTRAALGNVTPIKFVYGTFWEAPSTLPDYSAVIGGEKMRTDSGYVQSVKAQGAKVTIDFKTLFDNVEEPYNCVSTNRLTRIRPDGTLEYDTNCQYRSTRVARPKPAPVTFDAADAGRIESGELLQFLADEGRNGVVLEAMREKAVTQVRGDRVKPVAAAHPTAKAKR